MIRPPPRSTLFPTRRSSDLPLRGRRASGTATDRCGGGAANCCCRTAFSIPGRSRRSLRSEEHTSELQSRFDLVCRLLLEKKKKNTHKELPQVNYSTHLTPQT